jgi:hypothetical protein
MSNAAADTFIIFCLLATAGLVFTIATWLFQYVFCDKPQVRELPKRDGWLERRMTGDEISFFLKHLSIYDSIMGLGPKHYHNLQMVNEIEGHLKRDLGRDVIIPMSDWFEIIRAWYVTRDLPHRERIASLKLRLQANV